MPFRIDKKGEKYRLFNLTKKIYVKSEYNTKESAVNAGKNFIRYREKTKSKVEGNKILPIKKNKK